MSEGGLRPVARAPLLDGDGEAAVCAVRDGAAFGSPDALRTRDVSATASFSFIQLSLSISITLADVAFAWLQLCFVRSLGGGKINKGLSIFSSLVLTTPPIFLLELQ